MKKRFLFVGFGLLLLSASPSVAQVAGFSEESGGIRKGQGQEVRIRGIRDSVVRIAPPCSGNIRCPALWNLPRNLRVNRTPHRSGSTGKPVCNGIDPQDAGIARRLFSLHENNSPRRCPDASRSRPHEAERRRRSEESIRHISVLT